MRVSHAVNHGFFINGELLGNGDSKSPILGNVPVDYAADTFLTTAKAFTGGLLDQVELHGTLSEKWKPMILRKISLSQLSPKYGGSKDRKPLPLN